MDWEGKDPDKPVMFQTMAVNHDFIETLNIEMKEGRFFSRSFGADTNKIILNEGAINVIRFENPIDRKLNDMEIIGVIIHCTKKIERNRHQKDPWFN